MPNSYMEGLFIPVIFLALAPVSYCQTTPAQSDEIPAALPARPTISSPAGLPPTGYLQFEQGFQIGANSPASLDRQTSLVQATKIALTDRLQAQILSQPIAHTSFDQGPASNDTGDLLLGAQYVIHLPKASPNDRPSKDPTIAVAYVGRVRTGTSADLDVGSYRQGGQLLISQDLFGFHYDNNYLFNEQVNGSLRRLQTGQTLSVSHSVTKKLGAGVEIWHFTQPLVPADRQGITVSRANAVGLLVNVSYQLRNNLVFDAGFDHGLTSTSTAWEGFGGFTYLLPHRLIPARNH